MSTTVPLPTGSYVLRDPRAETKRLVNAYSDINPQTSSADTKQKTPPVTLLRAPGMRTFATGSGTKPPRGAHTMAGVTYVVIGAALYIVSATGVLTQIATGIAGNSFLRMADNTACLFILVPGTTTAYTYCPNGGGFALFNNATFTSFGAIDVWFDDSFFVFLALNGREFYNDDGQAASGQGPPTFLSGGVFPREFGTDLFVGGIVDHREAMFFGQLTSEGFVNAGNPTFSPFSSAPDSFMEIGAHPDTAYAIAKQDQSVFWVANDRTVRRRSGQTPVRVSNSGIESILEKANLVGCYALTPTIKGHPWWILNMPAESRAVAYDCLTQEWWEPSSGVNNIGYWRPLFHYNALGKQLVGDSQTAKIGYLDSTVFTEFDDPMTEVFITQPVYDDNNRIVHRRLDLVLTAGGTTDLTANPKVTLYISDDGGWTFRAGEERALGQTGQHQFRTTWFNLGQSRNRVYRFQISDPAPTYTVDIQAELDGGKW